MGFPPTTLGGQTPKTIRANMAIIPEEMDMPSKSSLSISWKQSLNHTKNTRLPVSVKVPLRQEFSEARFADGSDP